MWPWMSWILHLGRWMGVETSVRQLSSLVCNVCGGCFNMIISMDMTIRFRTRESLTVSVCSPFRTRLPTRCISYQYHVNAPRPHAPARIRARRSERSRSQRSRGARGPSMPRCARERRDEENRVALRSIWHAVHRDRSQHQVRGLLLPPPSPPLPLHGSRRHVRMTHAHRVARIPDSDQSGPILFSVTIASHT